MGLWWWGGTVDKMWVVGCSPWGDMYPNIKYRASQIDDIFSGQVKWKLYKKKPFEHQGGDSTYLFQALSLVIKSFWLALLLIWHRPAKVYITYPSIFILLFFRLLGGGYTRCQIYTDVFILISETLIEDRKKIRKNTFLAQCLIFLEGYSLRHVTCIVDTPCNVQFVKSYLNLTQVVSCPLCVPPLAKQVEGECGGGCVLSPYAYFVGTFVPLQGVATLIEAHIKCNGVVPLVIRGDGQDGECVRRLLVDGDKGVDWRSDLILTGEVSKEISNSIVCMGVFGSEDKADRVIPFKVYQYLQCGKPVITRDTRAMRRLQSEIDEICSGPSPLILVPLEDLESTLCELLKNEECMTLNLLERAKSAKFVFDHLLSNRISRDKLAVILQL